MPRQRLLRRNLGYNKEIIASKHKRMRPIKNTGRDQNGPTPCFYERQLLCTRCFLASVPFCTASLLLALFALGDEVHLLAIGLSNALRYYTLVETAQ